MLTVVTNCGIIEVVLSVIKKYYKGVTFLKHLLTVLLGVGLLLMISGSALAAVHVDDMWDDAFALTNYHVTDTWYTTNYWPSYVNITYLNVNDGALTDIALNYFKNDQLFASYRSIDAGGTGSIFKGSYLFDFGLFVGAWAMSGDMGSTTVVSPGYRFKFGEKSWVALSADYNTDAEKIVDYDLDFLIFPDKMKIDGEVLMPDGSDAQYKFNFAYQISDSLTVGAGISKKFVLMLSDVQETNTVGASFTGIKNLVLDCQVGTMGGESGYAFGGMYSLGKSFAIGADYIKLPPYDGGLTFKGVFHPFEYSNLIVKYCPENPAKDMQVSFEMYLP